MGRGTQEPKSSHDLEVKEKGVDEKKGLIGKVGGKMEEGTRTPPDGGWGWAVVAASFLCNMVLDGIAYSFGCLLGPLMEHFDAGKGVISLVGSILAGVIMTVGPIASFLVNKFGTRIVCISGALTSGLAIFISTYSPNIYFLMIVYGVIGGLGLGLMYVPAVVSVGYWFEKRRSLVTGISTCGSGAGTIVFAPLVTSLEKSLGWQNANRVLSGLCLLCALFGFTMKPVPLDKKDEEDSISDLKNANKQDTKVQYEDEEIAFIDGQTDTKAAIVKNSKTEEEDDTKKASQGSPSGGVVALLKNPAFLMIMLGNLPAVMGLYIPYMFLPEMAKERGLTDMQASLLITLIGVFNTIGRIVSGALTDHPKVDALFVTCGALFFGAVCPLLMDFCSSSFAAYVVVSIGFGWSLSAWPAVTSSMLVDLLGLEMLTSAFGVLTCIRGIAAFLGPPTAGFVIDAGQSYSYAFYISATLLGVSSLIHAVAFFLKRRQQATK